MEKFNYTAKMQFVQHMIDDLNSLIDNINILYDQVKSYIDEITGNILDDNMRYQIRSKYNEYYAEYYSMITLIPDRLLVLKDDMISKMIIIPEGNNINGIIMETDKDFITCSSEINDMLIFLENNLHSS